MILSLPHFAQSQKFVFYNLLRSDALISAREYSTMKTCTSPCHGVMVTSVAVECPVLRRQTMAIHRQSLGRTCDPVA